MSSAEICTKELLVVRSGEKKYLISKITFYQFLISSFPLISDLRQFSYSNSERASNSTCFDISFVKIGAGLCEISQIAVLRRRNCVGGFFWWHRVETLNQTRCAKFQLIPTIFQFYRGHPSLSSRSLSKDPKKQVMG